mmetsp:Transcript_45783/g.103148  ORF Transcript_45783/g.103148 Transcript_45783/m.103148 type:complete len:274 (-) Transcript_45783:269-1090(-)
MPRDKGGFGRTGKKHKEVATHDIHRNLKVEAMTELAPATPPPPCESAPDATEEPAAKRPRQAPLGKLDQDAVDTEDLIYEYWEYAKWTKEFIDGVMLKMDAGARRFYKVDTELGNASFLAGRMLAHWETEKASAEQVRARVEAGEPPNTPRTRAVVRGEASEAEVQEFRLRRGTELRDRERRIAQESREAQELQEMFKPVKCFVDAAFGPCEDCSRELPNYGCSAPRAHGNWAWPGVFATRSRCRLVRLTKSQRVAYFEAHDRDDYYSDRMGM